MRNLRQLATAAQAQWQTLQLCDRWRSAIVLLLVPVAALAAYDARPIPTELPLKLEPVASGLTAREAEALRAHLELRRVPFEIRDGGQTVLVPADRRAELTVELTQIATQRDAIPPDWTTETFSGAGGIVRESSPKPK